MSAPKRFIPISLMLMIIIISTNACGGNSKVISTYEGGTITAKEFQEFKGVIKITNPYFEDLKNEPEVEETLLKQLIAVKIIFNEADPEVQKIHQKEAEEKVEILKQDYLTRSGNKKAWDKLLQESETTETEMVQYFKHYETMREKLGQEISDQELKAAYEVNKAKNEYEMFTLKHILIAYKGPNEQTETITRTKEEALQLTEEIKAKLEQGADFTPLYEAHSDDPSTAAAKGIIPNITMAELPPQLSEEIIKLSVGGVSNPVDAVNGYHLIQVSDRKVQTFEEVKEGIHSTLISLELQQYIQNVLPDKIEKINL